tara:strand:- start:67 stop:792 length:726 start_codon:yes stop_codon:yes gene_type:complete
MKQYYNFIFKSYKKYKLITIYLIIKLFTFRKLSFLNKKYYKKYLDLNEHDRNFKKKGIYSEDWFSYNIKYLSRIIYKFKIIDKKISILEIGSYEGLSTVFFLSILKNSKIYCVDPFIDFEENKDKDFNKVLKNFKHNTQKFESRIRLSKSTSDDFFLQEIDERFDLIYIDGNHHADNVYKDSINSFKLLNKKGLMIFDDFLWDYYDEINLNPIGGVKRFLYENFFKVKIVSIGYQIIIQKK